MRRRIELVMLFLAAAALAWVVRDEGSGRVFAQAREKPVPRVEGTSPRDDVASVAAFQAMLPVLHHARCMNCHSTGDYPRQGDDGHPHTQNVRRGLYGRGVTAQQCATCHQATNTAGPNMPPGAPSWHMPRQDMPMIWEGLSDRQICEQLKDPKQNGKRSLDRIVEHMSEDPLVGWGWSPGEGRTPIPLSRAAFAASAHAWVAKGAACPW